MTAGNTGKNAGDVNKPKRASFDIEKNKLAKSIKWNIQNVPFINEHCVYKLYYGDRYIINKCQQLAPSLYMLQNGYANYIAYEVTPFDQKKNKLYLNFYEYIKKHPDLPFRLEILMQSDNPYQILKAEQIALNKAINDKKCLNSELVIYIPKWRPETKTWGSWIKNSHMLNFKKFLKNHS